MNSEYSPFIIHDLLTNRFAEKLRSTTKGVETTKRKTISTGDVPKLNSNHPSAMKASQAAIVASASHVARRDRARLRRILQACQTSAIISQTQASRQGSPRSAPN